MAAMCFRKSLVSSGKGLRQNLQSQLINVQSKRHGMFSFLDVAWNRVDQDRIKAVGPEKAAAEWLLRCGAKIKWRGQQNFLSDYNAMELTSGPNVKIADIDATESCITADGFAYLKGLSAVKSVKFHRTHNIDNVALSHLDYIGDTLEDLEVSSCGNVSDSGIKKLSQLKNLTKLYLHDLPGVKSPDDCVTYLKTQLPKCNLQFDSAEKKEK